MKNIIYLISIIKRLVFKKLKWYNLRSTEPISKSFGFDRGIPIDRLYIEDFLKKNNELIKGTILEIADNTYSKKYGKEVIKYEILHATIGNKNATIVGDLADITTLPENRIDCFICTQTFNFIYDFHAAIKGAYHILKNDGVILATVAGISQISRYDMDRWGDYWRFTTASMQKSFGDIFGNENVEIDFYGNVLSSVSFLEGICSEELSQDELFYKDQDYQMIIVIKARKKVNKDQKN